MKSPDSKIVDSVRSDCLRLVREGKEMVDLSMINPDLAPSQLLVDRLVEASIKPSSHRYSAARGIRRLREGFAEKYSKAFAVRLHPEDEICVTDGSKDALLQLMSVLRDSITRVLLPAPTYPAFLSAARLLDYDVDYYPVQVDEDEMVATLSEKLEKKPGQLLILNFPNNPTGKTITPSGIETLLNRAHATETTVVNDFVYGELGFDAPYPSILASSPSRHGVLEIYSLSKAYSVPGWRVAALVGDREIVRRVAQRRAHTSFGIFTPIQIAASAALRAPSSLSKEISSEYQLRRDYIASELRALGFSIEPSQSGVSVWAQIPNSPGVFSSGGAAVQWFMEKCGVVALPGEAFGQEFQNYMRFAAVRNLEILQEAFQSIRIEFENLKGGKHLGENVAL